ncbi:MAG: 2-phosphosulfolactate phosphatase [Candidatus Limnocylindrales bacterium]
MKIEVALVPNQARPWRDVVGIVIDELRASCTIVSLLDAGCSELYLSATLREARRIARATGAALVGERHGRTPRGFDYNNSPAELRDVELGGRPVVLCTTNGTNVLTRLRHLPATLVGCLVNAQACAEAAFRVARGRGSGVGIACAGTASRFALDDMVAAGIIVADLLAVAERHGVACQLDDAALAARRLAAGADDLVAVLDESIAGRLVTSLGAADDVILCGRLDASRTVPILRLGPPLTIARLEGGEP